MANEFDSRGNLHIGPFGRASNARITVDFDGSNNDGVALDAAPSPQGVSERAVIKLGDFTIGQDTAQNGTKDFRILDANSNVLQSFSQGVSPGLGPAASVLFQFSIPLIIAPTGSFADNGVLTSGTANPLTYLKTFTWFPAGAIKALSAAGWYYTVWTTTTAATVYTNTWGGASDPVVPATPVAWSGTGPGAFTGPTTDAAYISLPMAAAGVNSLYDVSMQFKQTNNANAKTCTVRMNTVAGTLLWTNTLTSFLESSSAHVFKNNGVADKQELFGMTLNATAFVRQASALTAETLSAAWVMSVCASKADATDVVVIESVLVTRSR